MNEQGKRLFNTPSGAGSVNMGTKEQEPATSWWGNPLGRMSAQKGQEKRLEQEPEIVPAEKDELPPVIRKHRITVEGITEEEAEDLAAYFRSKDGRVTVQSGEGRVGSPLRMGAERRSTSSGSRSVSNASSSIEFLNPDDHTVVLPIKVSVATVLAEDGTNYAQWEKDVQVAVLQKGEHCCQALTRRMPGTKADAAVQSLLRGSIGEFQKDCTLELKTACEIFEHIRSQYVGGRTRAATKNNRMWRRDLETTKMKRDQKLRSFVLSKKRLLMCMLMNGCELDPEALTDSVLLNLPPEFANQVDGLANSYAEASPEALEYALERAAERIGWIDGVGPRVPPPVVLKVAAVTATPQSTDRKPRRDRSEIQCWSCHGFGHFENQCPQRPQEGEGHTRGASRDRQPQHRRGGPGNGARNRPTVQAAVGVPTAGQDAPAAAGITVSPRLLSITNNVFDPGIPVINRNSWSADSGATIILTNDLSALHEPTYYEKPAPIYLATNAVGGTVAIGSLCVQSGDKVAWLHKVHCDPAASQNLLSVSAAVALGFSFQTNEFGEPTALLDPSGVFCHIEKRGGLYNLKDIKLVPPVPAHKPPVPVGSGDILTEEAAVVNLLTPPEEWESVPVSTFEPPEPIPLVSAVVGTSKPEPMSAGDRLRLEYHERLGHLNAHALDRLITEDLVEGLPDELSATGNYAEICETCIMGKGTRLPYSPQQKPATRPLQRLHMDTAVMLSTPGVRGELYFVTIICEYSGWKKVLLIRDKSKIAQEITAFLMELMNKRQLRVEELQTDRGTEFINKVLTVWRKSMGIGHRKSCVRTPQQNGRAERCIRTLKDMARTVMIGARGSPYLWPEALEYVTFVSNCMPVSGKPLTPHETLWGEKPSVANLRKWGCRAYVRVHEAERSGVLAPRFVPGMFVGLEEGTKGWRVRLPNRTTVTSREVRFLEDKPGVSDVDTIITAGDLDSVMGEFQEISSEGIDPSAMLGPAHPLWRSQGVPERGEAMEPAHTEEAAPPRRSIRLQAQRKSSGEPLQALVTPCKQGVKELSTQAPVETPSEITSAAEEQCGMETMTSPIDGAAGEAEVEPQENTSLQTQGVPEGGEAAASMPPHEIPADELAEGAGVLSQDGAPPTRRVEPRRSARIRAMQEKKARKAESPGVVQPEFLPMFKVVEGSGNTCVISDGKSRYHLPAPSKEELSPEHRERLAVEMIDGYLRERGQGMREKDVSSGIPRHRNSFEGLADVSEESESESVDVTGYTGREEEVSEVDITGLSTQWSPENTNSPGVVCAVTCEKKREPQVRFSEKVTQRTYSCRSPKRRRPWEKKVHRYERKLTQAKWRAERVGRRGFLGENVTEAPPKPEDPEVLLARVNACLVEPAAPGEDVSDDEGDLDAWYNGGNRKESYDRSLFEQAATHPVAFTVTDGTGVAIRVPKTLAEAKKTPQWPYWDQACLDECDSIDKHGVKELVARPRNAPVLPAIWVLTPKFGTDGIIQRHKARLVAGGHRQKDGIDVRETFAPTALAVSRRCLLSYGAAMDYEIHQADIKTAFLHGDLEEEVYMEQPPGYGNGDRNMVWRLLKSLYGLKQAPRCWWIKLISCAEEAWI
jgi:transposase InsO family protein